MALKGALSPATRITRLPMAMAGASSDTGPSKGASSGQKAPITPTGSFIASATPRMGTDLTAPSNLSAQAA